MKVTAFYYLDYPDCTPADPRYAKTRMRVEVGEETDTLDHFGVTYAFQVYTIGLVEDEFFKKRLPLAGRSVIIVPELTDASMVEFLNANVDRLSEWGEKS